MEFTTRCSKDMYLIQNMNKQMILLQLKNSFLFLQEFSMDISNAFSSLVEPTPPKVKYNSSSYKGLCPQSISKTSFVEVSELSRSG